MARVRVKKDVPIFVRLPRELDEFLERVADSIGGTKSELVRVAVERMRPGFETLERVMRQIRKGDKDLALEAVLELVHAELRRRGVSRERGGAEMPHRQEGKGRPKGASVQGRGKRVPSVRGASARASK